MTLLAIGVLLFAGVHLSKSLAPSFRPDMQKRLGENGYKGIFSLLILGSIALIVFGWRSTVPQYLYNTPAAMQAPALFLLVVAFWLLVVSARPSRVHRLLRHPQLTGVGLWGVAHLLLNGDSRSLVLFGGMAIWALLEMFAINRRDGAWTKAQAPTLGADVINLVITAVVVAVVVYVHPWLSGMPVIGPLQQ
tara:strand:- start:35419 stop:35994 length:576 start_codon:yes stop_codon:yes gene_type:complete